MTARFTLLASGKSLMCFLEARAHMHQLEEAWERANHRISSSDDESKP